MGIATFRLLCEYAYLSPPERLLMVKQRHLYTCLVSKTTRYLTVSPCIPVALDGPVTDMFVYFTYKNYSQPVDAVSDIRLVLNGRKDSGVSSGKWASLVMALSPPGLWLTMGEEGGSKMCV